MSDNLNSLTESTSLELSGAAESMDCKESPSVFGIDIGGSGIKGALVDTKLGQFAGSKIRIATPEPAKPEAMLDVIEEIMEPYNLPTTARIGVTFPGVILHDVINSSANLHSDWIGINLREVLYERTGRSVVVMNDADAAGYAEVLYGAARGIEGTVLVLTLGTGIGSALICDGKLVPNTELGHLEINGHDAEKRAAASIRKKKKLTWEKWADRLETYLSHVEFLFSPDLFVIGGGVSKRHEEFFPLINIKTPMVPAELRNTAGIVGAGAIAMERLAGHSG